MGSSPSWLGPQLPLGAVRQLVHLRLRLQERIQRHLLLRRNQFLDEAVLLDANS